MEKTLNKHPKTCPICKSKKMIKFPQGFQCKRCGYVWKISGGSMSLE